MKRYFKLWRTFFKLSWMMAIEYKANFITWLLVDFGWAIMDVVSITAIAVYAGGLGPWNPAQVIFMTGLYRLGSVIIWGWLFQAFERIPALITEGGLDMILSKPVDSQFMVSIGRFAIGTVTSVIVSMIYIYIGAVYSHWQPSLYQVVFGLWTYCFSMILVYAIYFSSVACSLFVGRLNNIHTLFPNMFGVSRFPPEIYPLILQRFLIWVIPLALILVVPMQVFYGSINWNFVIILHIMTLIFLILGRWLWFSGLRHYSSASS